jgi:hypothetical protein
MVTTPILSDGATEVVLTPALNLSTNLSPRSAPVIGAFFCKQALETLIITPHSW